MEDKLNELSLPQVFLISLVVTAAYYFMIFNAPNPQEQIQNFKDEISILEIEIKKFDKTLKKMDDMEAQSNELNEELGIKLNYVPENIDLGEVSKILSDEAQNSGLNISAITQSDQWVDLSLLEYSDITVNLNGDFSSMMRFFSNLSRTEKLLVIQTVNVTGEMQALETQASSKRSLRVEGIIRIYRKRSAAELEAEENEANNV